MFNLFGKKQKDKPQKNTKQTESNKLSISETDIVRLFTEKYSPYLLKDYIITPRPPETFDHLDKKQHGLSAMGRQIELKRSEDPFIGAKLAGQEIFLNVTQWLKNDKGVQVEALLAVISSLGGRMCVTGIMDTLDDMVSYECRDREKLINSIAFTLGIMIAETNDGRINILGA